MNAWTWVGAAVCLFLLLIFIGGLLSTFRAGRRQEEQDWH